MWVRIATLTSSQEAPTSAIRRASVRGPIPRSSNTPNPPARRRLALPELPLAKTQKRMPKSMALVFLLRSAERNRLLAPADRFDALSARDSPKHLRQIVLRQAPQTDVRSRWAWIDFDDPILTAVVRAS